MHRFPRLVLVSVAAVALAACSSSGAPTPSAGVAPTPSAGVAASPAASSADGGPSAATSACQKTTETGGVAVEIDNFAFSPATVEAKVGQPITWTNQENISHGAVLDDDSSCSTGTFGMGGSGSLVFSAPGTYAYHCTLHGSSMTGTITITE